jgi:hypothetical protein
MELVSLNPAQIAHSPAKRRKKLHVSLGREGRQPPDPHRLRRRLRDRAKGRGEYAASHRADERPPIHH